MSIETFTDATFRERVEQFQGVVLIDFWAPWCGPCRAVGPLIEQLEQQFAGQVRIGKLHVDEQPATAARYRITSIPTVAIFRHGEVIHTLIGVQPLYVYQQALEAALHPSGSAVVNKQRSPEGHTHRVTVFSTPTCPWCLRLKAYLRQHQIAVKEIDVSRDAQAAQEMVRRSGQMGVPQAWIEVIDTRPSSQYLEEHIPGTVNVPYGPIFLQWAGWLLPFDRPFSLIVDVTLAPQAIRQLRLIGLDHVAHVWSTDALVNWKKAQYPLRSTPQVSVLEAQQLLAQARVTVLDIRSDEEYQAGHIPGSQHIHLGYLARRLREISPEKPVVVQCQAGVRSPIGASVLEALHHPQVMELRGGFMEWQEAGYLVIKGA